MDDYINCMCSLKSQLAPRVKTVNMLKQTVFALLILLLGIGSSESAPSGGELQTLDLFFAGFLTLAAFLQEFAGSLLTIGAGDPNAIDEEGFTSLQRAAISLDVEKVRELLQTPGIYT